MWLSYFNRTALIDDSSKYACNLTSSGNIWLQGNQDNRVVIFDNKIIDYINFILRAAEFQSCPTEKVS